jgi:hypothetical protein
MPTSSAAATLRQPVPGGSADPALPSTFRRDVGVLGGEIVAVNTVRLGGILRSRSLRVLQGVHPRRHDSQVLGVHTRSIAAHDVVEDGSLRNGSDHLLPHEPGRLDPLELGVAVTVPAGGAVPASSVGVDHDPVLPSVGEHSEALGNATVPVQVMGAQTAVQGDGITSVDGAWRLCDAHVAAVVPAPPVLSRRPPTALHFTDHGLDSTKTRKDGGSFAHPQ